MHVENSPDRAAWILCRAILSGKVPKLKLSPSAVAGRSNLEITGFRGAEREYARWKSEPANAFVSLRHAIHRAMTGASGVDHVLDFVASHYPQLARFAAGPVRVEEVDMRGGGKKKLYGVIKYP